MAQQVSTGWGEILVPGLKEVFLSEYMQIPSKISLVFGMDKSSRSYEEYLNTSGISKFSEFNGVVEDNAAYQGYKTRITPVEWASKLPIFNLCRNKTPLKTMEAIAA